jgi:hypothetical protein
LLAIFSSSKLSAFTPPTSRDFYKANVSSSAPPTNSEEPAPEHDQPRKRRRRSAHVGEWTCAEIRALESYKNLVKDSNDNLGLRNLLLPNRSAEEVKLQMVRIEKAIRERRRSKLQELKDEESKLFAEDEKTLAIENEKDRERRKTSLDAALGLDTAASTSEPSPQINEGRISDIRGSEEIKASLDQALGLVEETDEQRRKRQLDEVLGLGRR